MPSSSLDEFEGLVIEKNTSHTKCDSEGHVLISNSKNNKVREGSIMFILFDGEKDIRKKYCDKCFHNFKKREMRIHRFYNDHHSIIKCVVGLEDNSSVNGKNVIIKDVLRLDEG